MKLKKIKSNKEKYILLGMIVDVSVLRRISSKWSADMFKSKYANIISKWCVSYYKKYEEAPLNQIESIFNSWSLKTKDKNTIELISDFLSSLSNDYENLEKDSNSDYIIDLAGEYFNQVKAERLIDEVQNDIDEDKITEAVNQILTFNQVEMGVGEGVDILQDKDAIKEAFKEKGQSIIKYKGALGKFFGSALEHDGFIAFMGPDKVGKTFWLIDLAFRSMTQRIKVAFFEVGDMSQNQTMRRLMTRVSHRPMYASKYKYPTKIYIRDDGQAKVNRDQRECKDNLNYKKAIKACEKLMQSKIKSRKSYFKLSSHPNSSLSVNGIKDILSNWAKEDWIPEVIVIDYADILNMTYPGIEGRDRINETWKQLRSLSQIYHCLVVTATQSDAKAYDSKTLSKNNFSDDKRKLAHVTGMIGINVTEQEKKKGITRLNWVVLREGEFLESNCVYVAGCLSESNPAVRSCF